MMHSPTFRLVTAGLLLGASGGALSAASQPGLVSHEGVLLPPGVRPIGERSHDRSTLHSVARLWNEELLDAIRRDTPRPPVHSRNLFHVSAAMYDAWAAYDSVARPVFRQESASAVDIEAARAEAISYAAYRMIAHRFAASPGAAATTTAINNLMGALGYDPGVTTTVGDTPAAIGNRIAARIIAQALTDGSNELGNYANTSGYAPINGPLVVALPGTGGMVDINRWQPLLVPGALNPQGFLAPHWSVVRPFAMSRPAPGSLYLDPGPPPLLGGAGDATVRHDILQVIEWSGQLDPTDSVMINTSPSVTGNNSLGAQDGTGHPVNPVTGMPYADNFVLRGDFGRVLAEFWADGPLSSTPPGHWNEIANEVSDSPGFEKRIGGVGPIVNDLEWDVKMYLSLNGAVHDTAIATWEVKAHYDGSRPISLIREMASRGQSTDPMLPSYDPMGLPLQAGLVELITPESSAPGERHEHLSAFVGEIAIFAWRGHPADPVNDFGGCGWIRAVTWLPYQQFNFVTPPFAGYTSGHSGFSRASAEVLTLLSGTPYFPGGQGVFVASDGPDGFDLVFEAGPSMDVVLVWATYYDAADEAGLSRIFGGIHPAYDDFPGRVIGSNAGIGSYQRATRHFTGLTPFPCAGDTNGDNIVNLADLNAILTGYGQSGSGQPGDVNGDGVVNFLDLNTVLVNFGASCD
ncbi:MAG: hypothetical protein KF684_02620 [Phycisphaeraceae bacterium]|nr:hypothetical protein [Phycisphaeraceae bacterium]